VEDPTTFDSLVKNVAGVEPEAAMIGETCGSYKIIAPLGAGGMGWVFLAEHTVLGSRAAIKVLKPTQSHQQHLVKRFFDEARAASRVADPGIITVLDFGWHPSGVAYLVMEYLTGETLTRRIRNGGRLAPAQALAVIRQCAIAMAAAHARGIVHRDLKPDNIFIVPDRAIANERIKILDFGIAKLGEGDASHGGTVSGLIMGTPGYMSPEQCRGAGAVDHRTDIYALGCVLFFALTGRPPFIAPTPGDLIAAHLTQTPPTPSSVVPGLAPALDELVARCMAKNVIQRIQTMADLSAAVDAIAAALGAALAIGTEPAGAGVGAVGAGPAVGSAPAVGTPVANGPGVVEPATTVEGARSGRRFAIVGSVVIAAATTLGIVLVTRGDDADRAVPSESGDSGNTTDRSGSTPGGSTPSGSTPGESTTGSTPGGPTAGGSTAGGSTPGSTPGGPTAGGSTAGGPTPGGSTAGGSTPGGSTPGGSAGGSTPIGSTSGSTHGGSTPGGSTSDSRHGASTQGSTPGGSTASSTHGGSTPGGSTASSTHGGSTAGGSTRDSTRGGSTPGGSTAGSTPGGSTAGSTHGGSTPGGSTRGGSTPPDSTPGGSTSSDNAASRPSGSGATSTRGSGDDAHAGSARRDPAGSGSQKTGDDPYDRR
jgi:tRNA A-37 threonylcarbamoyl transferase component Bud32